MIFVVVGNIGSGKTLFLTFFTYLMHYSGYTIYANYHLKNLPYISMDKISDFLNIKTEKNWFALDEFWISSDSRRSGSFMNMLASRHMLQSRKIKSHVMITTQDFGQLDKRIRNITSVVLEPTIIAKDNYGKPLMLEVEYTKLQDKNPKIKRYKCPMVFGNVDIPNSYDTFEIVEDMEYDIRVKERERLVDKYIDSPINKKGALADIMRYQEEQDGNNLIKSEASLIASVIIESRKQQI